MYLHIGGNTVINTDDVIIMLEKDEAMMSRDTRRALDAAMGSGGIRAASQEPQTTYIILSQSGPHNGRAARSRRNHVYSSPISAGTLAERSRNKEF